MTGAEPYSAYQQDRGFVSVRPVQAARFFVCIRGKGQSAVQYGSVCFRFSFGGSQSAFPFPAGRPDLLPGVRSIAEGNSVVAIVAPSFVGQFGKDVTVPKFVAAMKQLGFADVVEVAAGADVCAIEEAQDFVEKVPAQQKFLATSCCPSWRMMRGGCFRRNPAIFP